MTTRERNRRRRLGRKIPPPIMRPVFYYDAVLGLRYSNVEVKPEL